MKTPFDRAASVQRRTLDRVRFAIADVLDRARVLEERERALADTMIREREAAQGQVISLDAYFERVTQDRAGVGVALREAAARLDQLRGEARVELASLEALERAAGEYRAAQKANGARREQAAADDRSAATVIRLAHARRWARS